MAFNGSGTFVRVHNFATDKTNLVPATASRMDAEFDGIATGLTTVITKDGQTPTTVRIPFAAGTSAFAGSLSGVAYAQTSDTNTGVYFPATDEVALAAGGVAAISASATAITVPSTHAVSFLPAGIVVPYAGASVPAGWLACDGASLLRASYPALFTAIGTTHGAADGTHFSLPDITGRVIAGKESSATRLTAAVSGVDGGTLGASGGSQSHTLTTAQLASHSHTGTSGGASANHVHPGTTSGVSADHTHTYSGTTSDQNQTHTHSEVVTHGSNVGAIAAGAGSYSGGSGTTGNASQGHTHTYSGTSSGISADHSHTFTSGIESVDHSHDITTNTTGSGTAHNNAQPTIVLNYIIKAY